MPLDRKDAVKRYYTSFILFEIRFVQSPKHPNETDTKDLTIKTQTEAKELVKKKKTVPPSASPKEAQEGEETNPSLGPEESQEARFWPNPSPSVISRVWQHALRNKHHCQIFKTNKCIRMREVDPRHRHIDPVWFDKIVIDPLRVQKEIFVFGN
ncbi:hypothetical protein JTE90_007030 [Oedothorax gibbosus]|uniref:Uncharacterized protein n=1 Tax=Oedothorax gibbosus TaxID=931172 RepID=A0AAV6U6R9_9ARAC|nr:hypothetical protein JTE90_007030 [Oedothorax gibbosus]